MSRTEEAERIPSGLDAYDRRALMPMRRTTGRAKLRCPTTAVAPDVFGLDSAPGRLPAPPSPPRRPKARPVARSPRLWSAAPVHGSRYHRAAPIPPPPARTICNAEAPSRPRELASSGSRHDRLLELNSRSFMRRQESPSAMIDNALGESERSTGVHGSARSPCRCFASTREWSEFAIRANTFSSRRPRRTRRQISTNKGCTRGERQRLLLVPRHGPEQRDGLVGPKAARLCRIPQGILRTCHGGEVASKSGAERFRLRAPSRRRSEMPPPCWRRIAANPHERFAEDVRCPKSCSFPIVPTPLSAAGREGS